MRKILTVPHRKDRMKYQSEYFMGRIAYIQNKTLDSCKISRSRLGMYCAWKAGWYDAQTEEEGWREVAI